MNQTKTELDPAKTMQSAKRGTKEVHRQQVLDTKLQLPGTYTITNCIHKPDYVIVTWFGQIFDIAM